MSLPAGAEIAGGGAVGVGSGVAALAFEHEVQDEPRNDVRDVAGPDQGISPSSVKAILGSCGLSKGGDLAEVTAALRAPACDGLVAGFGSRVDGPITNSSAGVGAAAANGHAGQDHPLGGALLTRSEGRGLDATGKGHDENEQVTHPASLPPDLAKRLACERYNEDEGTEDPRERGYRKGWNDHAQHMLRLLAAREAL